MRFVPPRQPKNIGVSSLKIYENAYHNQTFCETNNAGHISVNRWHVADNVPFQTSFEGCIEKYYPNYRPTLYACTAYWYLAPGGTDPYESAHVYDRICYWGSDLPTPVPSDTMFVEWARITLTPELPEGAMFRYTLDGSEPTETSWGYYAPIEFAQTMPIKARTFAS